MSQFSHGRGGVFLPAQKMRVQKPAQAPGSLTGSLSESGAGWAFTGAVRDGELQILSPAADNVAGCRYIASCGYSLQLEILSPVADTIASCSVRYYPQLQILSPTADTVASCRYYRHLQILSRNCAYYRQLQILSVSCTYSCLLHILSGHCRYYRRGGLLTGC